VRKNEVGRILRVRAGRDAQVVGNQARRGIDLSCVKALEGSHRIVATGNESQGGLKVHCETQGAVVLRGNTLTGGAHGVLVTHGRDVRVGQNTITGNARGVEAWNRTRVTLTGTSGCSCSLGRS
jgi:nitrous oxidase accessory protein NosD